MQVEIEQADLAASFVVVAKPLKGMEQSGKKSDFSAKKRCQKNKKRISSRFLKILKRSHTVFANKKKAKLWNFWRKTRENA